MVIIPQLFYVETDSFKKRSAQWSLRRVEPRIIEKNLSLNSSKTIVLLVRLGVKCRIVWQNEQKYPMYDVFCSLAAAHESTDILIIICGPMAP